VPAVTNDHFPSAMTAGAGNRVHFSLPDARLAGRILIGILTEHLTI
jgi:hypothetical protein